MADLHVLRRTDSDLLHVARSDDAARCAAALGSGQAFEVEVAAVLPGLGAQLPAVQQRLGAPVRACWYAAPLAVVLSALAASMAQPEPAAAADAGPVGGESTDAMESCEEEEAGPLQQYLEPCSIAEADKAADVLRALRERLGKQEADAVLRCARQVTLAGADGKKRRVFKAGRVRGQALRLKR
jgi:hypothetical protein